MRGENVGHDSTTHPRLDDMRRRGEKDPHSLSSCVHLSSRQSLSRFDSSRRSTTDAATEHKVIHRDEPRRKDGEQCQKRESGPGGPPTRGRGVDQKEAEALLRFLIGWSSGPPQFGMCGNVERNDADPGQTYQYKEEPEIGVDRRTTSPFPRRRLAVSVVHPHPPGGWTTRTTLSEVAL